MAPSLHPILDKAALVPGDPNLKGGVLRCHCASEPVEITLSSPVLHNHACGCSKCWKPKGALFSIVAVVPRTAVAVTAHANKLHIVDTAAAIQRHACTACGVHLYGRIETEHAFHGLDFVHVELAADQSQHWQEPQFAAFVSSVLEQGLLKPADMDGVRARLHALGLETYDTLSPQLMDLLATFAAKKAGALPADA